MKGNQHPNEVSATLSEGSRYESRVQRRNRSSCLTTSLGTWSEYMTMNAEFVAIYQLSNECGINGKAFLLVLSKHSPFVVFSRTSRRRFVNVQ